MPTRRTIFRLLLPLAALGVLTPWAGRADPPPAPPGDTLTVVMEDCRAVRPGKVTRDTSIASLLKGLPREDLVKRGTVRVGEQTYTLYLAEAKAYTTKNEKPSDSGFYNTSTLISVNQGGGGRLKDEDGWFANLPLRLGDRMYHVAEIAADGSRIVLKPSNAPLRGAVVGRRCPPFAFKTAEGKEVSFESLRGRAFLLDIWSIT
jgi:hypothetical protein